VAVEVNCDLVPRRSFEATALKEGDQIEIVTLVGGG
jgi:thiamine biosynthesis protein ThiS